MESTPKYHVYIMTNKKDGVIYIGQTGDIECRVIEHKTKIDSKSFTARYNCDRLVYLEVWNKRAQSLKREAQLKKWKRAWKIELIESLNPEWMDIAVNWSIDNHMSLKSKRIKASIDYYKNIANLDIEESIKL